MERRQLAGLVVIILASVFSYLAFADTTAKLTYNIAPASIGGKPIGREYGADLTYGDLPLMFSLDKDLAVAKDQIDYYLKVLTLGNRHKMVGCKIEYLVNESYNDAHWISKVICLPYSDVATKNGTVITHDNCTDFGFYEYTPNWRWAWSDVPSSISVKAGKSQVVNFHCVWKAELGAVSDDIVPRILDSDLKELSWWNTSWNSTAGLTVTAAKDATDYRFCENISYQPEMQFDFDDLRFVGSDNSTMLGHYVSSKSDGNWAVICWKMNASTSNFTEGWMYYGNPDATSVSNIVDSYIFYDDFNDASLDTTKWDTGGSVVETGGYLVIFPLSWAQAKETYNLTAAGHLTKITWKQNATSKKGWIGVVNSRARLYDDLGADTDLRGAEILGWTDNKKYFEWRDDGLRNEAATGATEDTGSHTDHFYFIDNSSMVIYDSDSGTNKTETDWIDVLDASDLIRPAFISGSTAGNTVFVDLVMTQGWMSPAPSVAVSSGISQPPSNVAPTVSDLTEPTDPSTYSDSATYTFNATVCDADLVADIDTVTFEWDGTNTTITDKLNINTTCDDYYVTIDHQGVQSATAYAWYANDTAGESAGASGTFTIDSATGVIHAWHLNDSYASFNQSVLVVVNASSVGNVSFAVSTSGGTENRTMLWNGSLYYYELGSSHLGYQPDNATKVNVTTFYLGGNYTETGNASTSYLDWGRTALAGISNYPSETYNSTYDFVEFYANYSTSEGEVLKGNCSVLTSSSYYEMALASGQLYYKLSVSDWLAGDYPYDIICTNSSYGSQSELAAGTFGVRFGQAGGGGGGGGVEEPPEEGEEPPAEVPPVPVRRLELAMVSVLFMGVTYKLRQKRRKLKKKEEKRDKI